MGDRTDQGRGFRRRMAAAAVAAAAGAAWLAPAGALAATLSFSSPDMIGFTITQMAAGGSVSTSELAANGNPGAFLFVSQSVNAGSSANPTNTSHYFDSGRSYDPSSSGAILDFDFGIDSKMLQGFGDGQAGGVAVTQGGNIYLGPAFNNNSGDWSSRQSLDLTSGQFYLVTGSTLDTTQHPDFGSTGGTLGLGFYTANTSIGSPYTIVNGYDNWFVRIVNADRPPSLPAPATLGLLLVGLAGIRLTRRTA